MRVKSIVASTVMAGILSMGSPAQANVSEEVGVTGVTNWPETITVIHELHDKWDLPINPDGCRNPERCIHIQHYNTQDGKVGYTTGWTGKATIHINDAYDDGHWYRMMGLYHEFGHAMGLWDHATECNSSMTKGIPACGTFILGYNPDEYRKLRETWN